MCLLLLVAFAAAQVPGTTTATQSLNTLQKIAREPYAKDLVPLKDAVNVTKVIEHVLPPVPPANPLEFEYNWPPKPQRGPWSEQEQLQRQNTTEYFDVPDDKNSDQYVLPNKNVKPLTLKLRNSINKRLHELTLKRFAAFDMRADDIDEMLS